MQCNRLGNDSLRRRDADDDDAEEERRLATVVVVVVVVAHAVSFVVVNGLTCVSSGTLPFA
jgi:hypothetical protein